MQLVGQNRNSYIVTLYRGKYRVPFILSMFICLLKLLAKLPTLIACSAVVQATA
jgi:hypothetical protein